MLSKYYNYTLKNLVREQHTLSNDIEDIELELANMKDLYREYKDNTMTQRERDKFKEESSQLSKLLFQLRQNKASKTQIEQIKLRLKKAQYNQFAKPLDSDVKKLKLKIDNTVVYIKDLKDELKDINKAISKKEADKKERLEQIDRIKEDIKDYLSDKTDFTKKNLMKIKYNIRDVLSYITHQTIAGQVLLTINDVNFMLNKDTIKTLYKQLKKFEPIEVGYPTSDEEVVVVLQEDIYEASLQRINPADKIKFRSTDRSGFFDHYNNTKIDLKEFGIRRKKEVTPDFLDSCCLIDALNIQECPSEVTSDIKLLIQNSTFPLSKLGCLADKYDICIALKTERKDRSRTHVKYYGKNKDKIYHIGSYNNHFFAIKEVDITPYALKNYFTLYKKYKKLELFKHMKGPHGNNVSAATSMNSFDVIKYMFENRSQGYMLPIEVNNVMMSSTEYKPDKHQITNLKYTKRNLKLNEYKPKESNKDYDIVWADFETHKVIQGVKKVHEQDTIGFIRKGETEAKVLYGKDCGLKFLKTLKKDTILIFHNASYDFTFLLKYLWGDKVVMKGKRLIMGTFRFGSMKKNIEIKILDSYAMITDKLANFKNLFGLNVEKEIINHEYYNWLFSNEEGTKRWQSIEKALSYFTDEEDKKAFTDNITKWNLHNPENIDEFDAFEYRGMYCKMDCKVLMDGYLKFRDSMKEVTTLDILNYPTLASISYDYLQKKNCFEGVQQLSGVPQLFIAQCAVGGRTMLRRNEKQFIIDEIVDFDGVSLYPSAMNRIAGFPKGTPKILQPEQLNYDTLKTFDYYFARVKILSVGIKRDFPLQSVIRESIRHWTNDLVGETLFVGKVALEDLIEFQQVTFEIVDGYYFNEGLTKNINEVTKGLFDERVKQKKANNPIQQVYKLIMNSCYGKCGLKPIDEDIKIMRRHELNDYRLRYFQKIIYDKELYHKNDDPQYDKIIVKERKDMIDHYNNIVCSVIILDMSKRIMNEVMCLADDLGFPIYYQDTDSMHMLKKDVEPLANSFREKYNRELIGSNMGQFHSDFEIAGCKGEVTSSLFIGLGKKSYYDSLHCGSHEDMHIRMKGIPIKAIQYYAQINNISIEEVYIKLYNGEKIKFDLTCGGNQAIFEWNNNMYWTFKDEMTRSVKF